MAGLRRSGGPEDGFGGVGEVAAAQVGRSVALVPDDLVEELVVQLLHGAADDVYYVSRAGDPDGPVASEQPPAKREPSAGELVGFGEAFRSVPIAFIDADHAAALAGDSSAGKEIWRVGEDHVKAACGKPGKDLERIAEK